jgi:hypothetical protein
MVKYTEGNKENEEAPLRYCGLASCDELIGRVYKPLASSVLKVLSRLNFISWPVVRVNELLKLNITGGTLMHQA